MMAAGHVMAGGPDMWAWDARNIDHSLWSVDTSVPSATNIGPAQAFIIIAEIEYADGVIYGADTSVNTQLHSIDPNTGNVVSTLPLVFPPQGNVITAMEFIAGTLYAGLTTESVQVSETYLCTVDLHTGVVTLVGGASGIGSPTGGLAWNGKSLYAVSAGSSSPRLYRLDIASGAATLVGDVVLPGPTSPGGMTALEFGADGELYGLTNVSGTGAPLAGHLLRINPTTAGAANVGNMGNNGLVSLTSITTGCPILCDGDADGNGTVNVNDITYVVFRLGSGCP